MASSSRSSVGPLGVLPGMTFDPSRNRYFPTPKDPLPTPPPPPFPPGMSMREALLMSTGCREDKSKRLRSDRSSSTSRAGVHGRLPKSGKSLMRTRRSPNDIMTESEGQHIANLRHECTVKCGECHGENITSMRSFVKGAFYATTDHGKVIIQRSERETHGISICGSSLFGLHCDIPRMVMMVVADGSEPHVHLFQRHPDQLSSSFMEHSDMDLPLGNVYSMSSFDEICSIGGDKSITTIYYTNGLGSKRRMVNSDPLALHHWDRHLVYAGLRNGNVLLEDLRVPHSQSNRVGGTRKGKAVVGVKRLKDSAVPWGLLVSGMGDELLIYDVRYPSTPLRDLNGHINTYHTHLGLTTSSDDKYVIAAGSDNRLRLFSTLTGNRILPPETHPPTRLFGKISPNDQNPFRRVFNEKIENLDMAEDDLGLDVSVQGELFRYKRSR